MAACVRDGAVVRTFGASGEPRLRYLPDFAGPGNDALSFAVPDLVAPERRQSAAAALRRALEVLAASRLPAGLQLGAVPAECADEARRAVEAILPGMRCVAEPGRATCYTSTEGAAAPPPGARAESLVAGCGPAGGWLLDSLAPHYPPEYLRLLGEEGSGVVRPIVALSEDGALPIAHVLQEATDLSVGALFVESASRRGGVGAWLLGVAGRAISAAQGPPVVSLVECGNEASARTHARAGWSPAGGPLVWLAFAASAPARPPKPTVEGASAFAAWATERLLAGESAAELARRVGGGELPEAEALARLRAFAGDACAGPRACELVRLRAAHTGAEPPFPFAVWLREQRALGALAAEAMATLGVRWLMEVPESGEEALWAGLWALAEREEAWEVVAAQARSATPSPRSPRRPAPKGTPTATTAEELALLTAEARRILVLDGVGTGCAAGAQAPVASASQEGEPQLWVTDEGMVRRRSVFDLVSCAAGNPAPSLTHRFLKVLEDRGQLLHFYTQDIDGLALQAGLRRVTVFQSAACHMGKAPALTEEPQVGCARESFERHAQEADLVLLVGVAPLGRAHLLPGPTPRALVGTEVLGEVMRLLRWPGSAPRPMGFFVYGSLRPDDDAGHAWTGGFQKGMRARRAVVRHARMFEDTYASVVLGPGALRGDFAEADAAYADAAVSLADSVVGYVLSCEGGATEAGFMQKLAEADRIECFPTLYKRAEVDAEPSDGGPPMRVYIYHRPDCCRSRPVPNGDWLARKRRARCGR